MITDTTFFTNEPGYALLDRFKKTLKHVQKRKKALEQKLHKNPRQIRQILNSKAIGGEKIAKENQYLLLDDINL